MEAPYVLHLGLGGSLQPSPAQILGPMAEEGCWAQLGLSDSTGDQKAPRRQACGRRVSETAQGAEDGGKDAATDPGRTVRGLQSKGGLSSWPELAGLKLLSASITGCGWPSEALTLSQAAQGQP